MVLQRSPGHGVGVWALGNAFAILIGSKVHHMNLRPSILGLLDHMRYLGDGGLIECRGFFRASRVRNSVKWSHPGVASPGRKPWQHFTHTKPPEPLPGLQTILRKLHFPAKFTTPCQSLGLSCCLKRHDGCLAYLPRRLTKDSKEWSCLFSQMSGEWRLLFLCVEKDASATHSRPWMIACREAACEAAQIPERGRRVYLLLLFVVFKLRLNA